MIEWKCVLWRSLWALRGLADRIVLFVIIGEGSLREGEWTHLVMSLKVVIADNKHSKFRSEEHFFGLGGVEGYILFGIN